MPVVDVVLLLVACSNPADVQNIFRACPFIRFTHETLTLSKLLLNQFSFLDPGQVSRLKNHPPLVTLTGMIRVNGIPYCTFSGPLPQSTS